ncbi:hypothetical protein BEI_3534 [Halomonas beimenensis]|uniref:Uncharacterized protein n=1 Tax=Halomonas beimenensis TaxID=475662 RepID=A0A291PCF2_9GAMM|nr:hypothetical protein BEI_3534 [Halomonas beimenensis]
MSAPWRQVPRQGRPDRVPAGRATLPGLHPRIPKGIGLPGKTHRRSLLTGRLEVERLDSDALGDLDMVSAGVVYPF